jgi:hypothetical protein
MKRHIALGIVLLALSCGVAHAGGIGVGVFGGQSYPVLQDDSGNGTLFGVRVPVRIVPFVAVEPYYASTSLSDKATTVAGVSYTRQGFDEKVYGANVMFATGGPLSFYPFVGYGRTSFERPGYDRTFTSYNAGFGMGISVVPKVSFDVRGELQAVVDGHTTRKFGNATVGLSYSLFSVP